MQDCERRSLNTWSQQEEQHGVKSYTPKYAVSYFLVISPVKFARRGYHIDEYWMVNKQCQPLPRQSVIYCLE